MLRNEVVEMENRKVALSLSLAVMFIVSCAVIIFFGGFILVVPIAIIMQALLIWWGISSLKMREGTVEPRNK